MFDHRDLENLWLIALKSISGPSDTSAHAQYTMFGSKQVRRKFSRQDFFWREKRQSPKSGRILAITRTLRENWLSLKSTEVLSVT